MESKELMSSRHKRSKSDSVKKMKEEILGPSESFRRLNLDLGKAKGNPDVKRKPDPITVVQSSLNQEILQLERRLKDQMEVRGALEKALGYNRPSGIDSYDSFMPKPTKELIKEIAVLEVEVVYLEQYLLSLYRRAFDQQISTLSPTTPKEKARCPPTSLQRKLFHEDSNIDTSSDRAKLSQMPKLRKPVVEQVDDPCSEKLTGPGVHRCQSALSHRAVYSARISPSEDSLARALQTCHSQPLNFIEDGHCSTSGVISLAEYLGTNIADHIPDTPNRISEDMVRCMGSIYCKLADPPLIQYCIPSSPTSSFSSMSALSPQYLGDMWSPSCTKESTLDSRLINPFRVEGIKEFSGPYNAMVEVPSIFTDTQKLSEVEGLLQSYKSLVHRLETVDPRKMKNEEKIAFWINIHNSLMMHEHLVYGVPQKNAKKSSLLIRASCVIGGRSISAYTIQCYILGCRTHCPSQWFRSLLSPRMSLKVGGEWRAHAIERAEPLLHFALCSGSHSDPAVRVYSCKRVFQQLETAKVEYIRATVGIKNEDKILLPKIVDSYSKDINLSSQGIPDMIKRHLPETLKMAIKRCQQGKSHKIIEWVPYNFTFRYLLSRDLASPQIL
ncbi:uncharacterized protein A4U43_C03F8120 [Asparagus officinalis]|uniref:DUF547 domain-containing protein n=1 Tax=Asparagus officinalis TaxID=4686 RepID=A0A5P1F893_ASPOF|nr:uncharacterized protein LOC109833222 [Asparagus officinalis]ONK74596.1 uncharacterized protein A4U43_C03F8120 [Asparagus officinalis]